MSAALIFFSEILFQQMEVPMNRTLKTALAVALGQTIMVSATTAAGDQNRTQIQSPAAAKANASPQRDADKQTAQFRNDMRASKLTGMDVKNRQGEDLGEIRDLVIDLNSSRVHYAVLEFGGFLGFGDKLFAYPMKAFERRGDRDELILNVEKERLKAAPGFQRDKWPNWNERAYREEVDRYFGPMMRVEPKPDMNLVRASRYIGKDVVDAQGRDVGDLKDIVVSLKNGDIRYAMIEFDKGWFEADKILAVPMKSLSAASDRDELRVNVAKESLRNAPGIDKAQWNNANLNDRAWIADVDRYLVTVVTAVQPADRTSTARNDASRNQRTQAAGGAADSFATFDTDKDGTLSREEAKNAKIFGSFAQIDKNNDGRISRDEFRDQESRGTASRTTPPRS